MSLLFQEMNPLHMVALIAGPPLLGGLIRLEVRGIRLGARPVAAAAGVVSLLPARVLAWQALSQSALTLTEMAEAYEQVNPE